MCMVEVRPSQYHARVRGHTEIEFVENAFVLVDLNQLFVEILGDVKCLNGLFVITHVPNLN